MPVTLVEVGTAIGVAAIDNVLVELEEQGKIVGNLTYIKDALRIGFAAGGCLYNLIAKPGFEDELSSALGISALPLACHSIRNLVKKFLFKKTYPLKPSEVGYKLVEVAPTPPTASPPTPPTPSPGSYVMGY
ncbi:MAG: hypothetical protein QW253_00165 [Metallosphaera sp.]